MPLWKQYTREIFNEFKYHGTWLPMSVLNPGDIGYFRDGQFERTHSLADLHIPFDVVPAEAGNIGDLKYSSKGGVSIVTKVAGKSPQAGSFLSKTEAGLVIDFKTAQAILFQASDCEVITIADQKGLAEAIVLLKLQDKWGADEVVVTSVVRSKRATILISCASGGKAELVASSELGAGGLTAALKTSTQLKYASNLGMEITGKTGLTPLYKVSGFQRSNWFASEQFVTRDAVGQHPFVENGPVAENATFTELSPDDLNFES